MFFFQAEDGIRDIGVTGVQTCALPISDALTAPDETPTRPAAAAPSAEDDRAHAASSASRSVGTRACTCTGTVRFLRTEDRKSVVQGKSVELGGRRIIKKKKERQLKVVE